MTALRASKLCVLCASVVNIFLKLSSIYHSVTIEDPLGFLGIAGLGQGQHQEDPRLLGGQRIRHDDQPDLVAAPRRRSEPA